MSQELFPESTLLLRNCLFEAGQNQQVSNLSTYDSYTQLLARLNLENNPIAKEFILIKILEELINLVNKNSLTDRNIYRTMALIINEVGNVKLTDDIEAIKKLAMNYFNQLDN